MRDALNFKPAATPKAEPIEGRFIRLEKLDPARHGDDLWAVLQGPGSDPALWDYLPYGPFSEREAFDRWLQGNATGHDPLFYSVIDRANGQVQGILSLMSIVPDHGRIEIGHIAFGAAMQRTPKGTERSTCWASSASPWAIVAWNGNATTPTPAPSVQPSVSASSSKACSAITWWSRTTIAILPGIRLPTRNGRRWQRGSSAG